VVQKGAVQEVLFARDLVDQPRRISVSKSPIRELCRDDIFLMLQTCESDPERTHFRQAWAHVSMLYRQYATENDLARTDSDPPLPEGAPSDYFHKRGFLPKACGCPKATSASYILDEEYFKPILPYIDHFNMEWLKNMPPEEKQKLMWGLSTKLSALREIHFDMSGIDARWQLLLAVQFAKYAPSLSHVTFAHADPRAVHILRRFSHWNCTVKMD
jgi:hypothetical protein